MAAATSMATGVPTVLPASTSLRANTSSFRVAAPCAAPSRVRLVVRALDDKNQHKGGRERTAGERVSDVTEGISDTLSNAAEAVQDALNPNEDPQGRVKNRVSGGKGEVREVTNANKSGDVAGGIGAAVEGVKEAIGGAVKDVANTAGGNEGYDSSAQKGAFTTPNREKMKANYDPLKNKQ